MALSKVRALHPDIFSDDEVAEVSIEARWLFAGLWCFACDNGHLHDKPKQIKRWIYATDSVNVAELLRELEAQGLIERAAGWIFLPGLRKRQRVDWRYFKTCDQDGCEKPERPKRPDSQRETQRGHDETTQSPCVATRGHATDGDGDGDGDGDLKNASAVAAAAPTAGQLAIVPNRDDVTRICNHLADAIEANGSKRPTITAKWQQAARLMVDKDGRTEDEIHGAIDWCQRDEFWRANILSIPTLREKYDQLRLQAQRKSGGTSRTEEWRSMQERQMARAEAREREMGLR